MPKPLDPPIVAVFFVSFPVVERIAPELSVFGEVVGRAAGNGFRVAFLGVELKEFWVLPDIGAVESNENRNIADDLDASFLGVFLNGSPLPESKVLEEALSFDFAGELGLKFVFFRFGVGTDAGGPFGPGSAAEVVFEGNKIGVGL